MSFKHIATLTCRYTIPSPAAPIREAISRWGYGALGYPALIVHPEKEDDVVSAVNFAKQNKLQVLPAGGTHGSFVSVTPQSLYLEMESLDSIKIDKNGKTVTFGGGVKTGKLLKALAAEGFYTPLPDSNAVGVVGALLGGGTSYLLGIQGFMVDNVESLRVVTAGANGAQGRTVSADSPSAEDRALFNALCGAGYGLGVVVSATMKIHPIADLNLAEGSKVWSCKVILPPPALKDGVRAFLALQEQRPTAQVSQLLFVRSPPGTPAAGSPMIILSALHFGPVHEAEEAAAVLLSDELGSRVVHAETSLVPIENANDGLDPINSHAGFKKLNAAKTHELTEEGILATFDAWLAATDKYPDGKGTSVILSSQSTAKIAETGKTAEGKAKFVEEGVRARGSTVTVVTWCFSPETNQAMSGFGEQIIRMNVPAEEDGRVWRLPNTMASGASIGDLLSEERAHGLGEAKKTWDPEGLFWSPYVSSAPLE